MNQTAPLANRTGVAGSGNRRLSIPLVSFNQTVTHILICLALPTATMLADKGGGKPGGGGGGASENLIPPVVPAPVSYLSTQLCWEIQSECSDPNFQGIWVNGVNGRGLAVGHVKRPINSNPDMDDSVWGERIGTINVDVIPGSYGLALDGTGAPVATDTMVDLNGIFSSALTALNSARADGPWRIAYGREINEAGQIACQLLPVDEPRSFDTGSGEEPVPVLMVLGNLLEGTLVPVDASNTSSDQDFVEMDEDGDVLMRDGNVRRFFKFENGSFNEQVLPPSIHFPSFNSADIFSYDTETAENGRFVTDRLFRTVDGDSELLWERRGKDYDNFKFFHLGVSESGSSVYAATYQFIGGQVSFPEIPYRILSSTERIQLTEANANGNPNWTNTSSLSNALTDGEEELILHLYDTTDEYQIYKPNFGARFRIIATDKLEGGNIQNIAISPPWDNTGRSTAHDSGSPATYFGGYVAFSNFFAAENRHDSFILTPQP